MSGSPIYRIGYYQGHQDGHKEGHDEGFGLGAGLGAVGVIAIGAAVYHGKIGIDKLKDVAAARHEKRLLAMEQLETPAVNDDDNNSGNTDRDVNP